MSSRSGSAGARAPAEQHTIQRPPKPADAKRTPSEVIELIKRLAADHTNTQIVEQLDAAGMRTSTGLPFDEKAVRWLRWRYRIGPSQPRDGELTVNQIAERLGISDGTVYAWISTGKLAARRGPANRLYILVPAASRATLPPADRELRSTYRPKPKSGLQEVQFDATVPTVADRIAQAVVRSYLEPSVEPVFHEDSYGYRPGRSAHDALGVCRERCWRNDWVIDLDVRKFFDTVPWDLTLKAVAYHTDLRWVLLYVERWLKAPLQLEDGSLVERDRGTPQGSAISPLLANMFMHYAFDAWIAREFPAVQFERYCDDIIVHARSERQAQHVRAAGRCAAGGVRA